MDSTEGQPRPALVEVQRGELQTIHHLIQPIRKALEGTAFFMDDDIWYQTAHLELPDNPDSKIRRATRAMELHVQKLLNNAPPPEGWITLPIGDLIQRGYQIRNLQTQPDGSIIHSRDSQEIAAEIDAGIIFIAETASSGNRRQIPVICEVKDCSSSRDSIPDNIRVVMNDSYAQRRLKPFKDLCQTQEGIYLLIVGKDSINMQSEAVQKFTAQGGQLVELPYNIQNII